MNPIMRLADAIERGAKLRPQCFGALFMGGGSCALGAAYEAMTGKTDHTGEGLPEFFNIPLWLGADVVHKNDRFHMTREEIAAWLRTLPEAQESADAQTDKPQISPTGTAPVSPVRSADSEWATEQVNKLPGVTV